MSKRKSRPSEDGVVADTGNTFNTLPRVHLTRKQKAMNEDRAQRARNIMDAYGLEVGADESNLTDLLADLMHRSALDCEAENFDDALYSARRHFEAESEGSN